VNQRCRLSVATIGILEKSNMARKRKVQTKKREENKDVAKVSDPKEIISMYNIVICAQNGEAYYEKCLKELRNLYKDVSICHAIQN
jgi:hypothetical protein